MAKVNVEMDKADGFLKSKLKIIQAQTKITKNMLTSEGSHKITGNE